MVKSFATEHEKLQAVANKPHRSTEQLSLLQNLASLPLPKDTRLLDYHDLLLFLVAYPASHRIRALAESELERITKHLRKHKSIHARFENSGLPFTQTVTEFSHECVDWLQSLNCQIEIDSFQKPKLNLNELLRVTLPPIEGIHTTAGESNDELLNTLRVPKKDQVSFLVEQVGRLDSPVLEEVMWSNLGMELRLTPLDAHHSRTRNKIGWAKNFFHDELLKRFDHTHLFLSPLPKPHRLTRSKRADLMQVIKRSLALDQRETDPATHLEPGSVLYYELGRGTSVAVYGMQPKHQLPLESYIGYTLFKNGLPAAYGGAWILGNRAHFGVYLFKPFRGGESGMMLCELLRVYHQLFEIEHFEIEPYQFGFDNPDGIRTGAFWFYYRFGFRPADRDIRQRAAREHQKLRTGQQKRTSPAVLRQFTTCNMVLRLGKTSSMTRDSIARAVTRMIKADYNGGRQIAVRDAVERFNALLAKAGEPAVRMSPALVNIALWACAFGIRDSKRLKIMRDMARTQRSDPYAYQRLLRKLQERTT